MVILRLFLLAIGLFLAGSQLQAQPQTEDDARKEALSQARQLKSVFKIDEAIELLSPFVSPKSFDEEVMAELADCHFQSADFESAAGTYFMLASSCPGKIMYSIRLIQCFYRLRDYPNSIQAGWSVLQRDTIPAVIGYIGDAFSQMNMLDSAFVYYSKYLAIKPMNEKVLSKASDILLKAKDYDGALNLVNPFLEEDPDNITIAPIKGIALYRKGDYDQAADVFQRQEDIGNDTYPVHLYLGHCYWQTKRLNRAREEFLDAWQIDSTEATLAFYIGSVNAEAFYPFESHVKPWLDKAWNMLQPDPEMMYRLHQQYGMGYFKTQKAIDQAIEHYKEAYRYNPKAFSLLSSIGYCYEYKKDFKNALKWYEKYLEQGKPGTQGYEYVQKSIEFVKGKLFMEEPNSEK